MRRRIEDGLSYHAWFDSGLSLDKRTIILTSDSEDEINIHMSLHFIKCMTFLESINHQPICVIINSPGGEIHSSLAIYDRIIESPCKVCVRAYGSVMSGGSIILQAGDLRQMSPHTYMMIHNGTLSTDDMDIDRVKTWMKVYKNIDQKMYDIYYNASKSKISKSKIIKMCKDETVLTAKDALDFGLIDEIFCG